MRDILVRVGVSSEVEQWRVETYATKEPETLDWLDEFLPTAAVFFDVGANIGLYSLYAAKRNPECVVYAFEPAAQNYWRLCHNISINSLSNVVPCNFALADEETFAAFHLCDLDPGTSLHSFRDTGSYIQGPSQVKLSQGVLATTIDVLVERYGLPVPSLLKIDVDGAEQAILKGATTILRSSRRLESLLVELNWRDKAQLETAVDNIVRYGYKLTRTSDWLAELNGIYSRNYIFARAS